MLAKELYEFLKKFESLDRKMIKSNLKTACNRLYELHKGREGMRQLVGLSPSVFDSMLNPSHPSKIDIGNFIKIVCEFNLDIDEILTNKPLSTSGKGNYKSKIWTDELKEEFVQYYEQNGADQAASHYKIKKNSAETYYKNFKKETR